MTAKQITTADGTRDTHSAAVDARMHWQLKPVRVASTPASPEFVIRDTFSMPPKDYDAIAKIRTTVAKQGLIYTKSEVIRAGLLALESMPLEEMIWRLSAVEKIKPGRKV